MGSSLPKTEIEQWAILRAIVEAGSFAKAAARLSRSQSSVSYAVARLQERLGLALLQIEGRHAVLTPAGHLLLAEASSLIEDLERLEQRARLMVKGEEPHIRLLVDTICPKKPLFDALASFQVDHPDVEIVLSEVVRLRLNGREDKQFDLAITLQDAAPGPNQPLWPVEMMMVSSPEHVLQKRGGRLTGSILSRHPALVIEGSSGVIDPRSGQGSHWRVNTLDTAIEAVRRGLCHGRLPRHLIEQDLATGKLVRLPIDGGDRMIPIALSFADEQIAGPLTRELAALLVKRSSWKHAPA